MYLKRLEISGFKSFSDKVKLDFEQGITAVVGPNGCGKSNIIDAIRWCLGEMSAKSLRSNLMMDVVFNGSGSRPPQNMAEVTLTFDNTDKRLPIDFTDVAITRRLFRSGESEYYINKTQCRLRDVKELFLDTGMGEDGYSSMEQGKVEWVLQAKPEQRRELFEEAAGVSKYRARREETLRKLDRVDIDLSRLSDIVSVTKDQIKKLETAVTRAKTYERIKLELKNMEVADWVFQIDNAKLDLAQTLARLVETTKQVEELSTQTHTVDAELSGLRLEMNQREEELVQANAVLAKLEADIQINEERTKNLDQRDGELRQQIADISNELVHGEGRLQELGNTKRIQEQQLSDAKHSGSQIETEFATAQQQFEASNIELEQKKIAAKSIRDLIFERAQARAQLQQKIAHLASDLSRYESNLVSATKEKDKLSVEKSDIEILLSTHQKEQESHKKYYAELEANLKTISQQIDAVQESHSNRQAALLDITHNIAQTQGQIQSIHEQEQQDPYLAGAQAVLSQGIGGLHGPINRLFECADYDRDMVVSALGEHLGDLVADTMADAEQAIRYLADHKKGRIRVWVLEKISAQGDTNTLGTLNSAALLDKLRFEEKYKPLFKSLASGLLINGSTIYGTAFLNGGADPSLWKSHTALRRPELEKKLGELRSQKGILEEELARLSAEKSTAIADKERLASSEQEMRIQLEIKNRESDNERDRLHLLREEEALVISEMVQIDESKKTAWTLFETAKNDFAALQNQEQIDHTSLEEIHQNLTDIQGRHATLNADLQSQTQKHNAFLERLKWHESVLGHTNKDIENLVETARRQKENIGVLNDQIAQAKNMKEEALRLLSEAVSNRGTAQETVFSIQQKRTSLAEIIGEKETALHSLRDKLTATQETVQTDRIAETTLQGRLETLSQKLFEQYELNLDAAKAGFAPLAADIETLDKLKKRVANIGPINLAAPQEHEELTQKHDFLTQQQNDLLKAKDDLRQVISKINATTRDHFRETFDKVRTNFQTLYGLLFQGGEADIRLTDENDILNSGIDIYCQPPGKKVMHISLLSGGEKALTACALLFAFFQVRPSPVALLDEVDAPLDEANILRFVDLIKMFSQKSQFLLISHNKRTMEAASNLYGVTMEEFGVSKILSARLAKDRKKIEETIENKEPASV